MAREFNGTNERISLGNDASIGGFAQMTICCWVRRDTTGVIKDILVKDRQNSAWGFNFRTTDNPGFRRDFNTQDGQWSCSDDTVPAGELHHVAMTYDNSDVANDPAFFMDSALHTTTESAPPIGTAADDTAIPALVGENGGGANDYDGLIGWLNWDNTLWTQAQINLARWYGTVGRPKVYHPWLTSSLTNQGTATADGVATGTVVTPLPRVERCWGSMMGCGR